jgi:hypothetical protein
MRDLSAQGLRPKRHLWLGVLLVWSLGLSAVVAADVLTSVRTFRLEHRSVAEASQLVQPMLSGSGRLTVEPRRSSLTVQDVPEVVEAIAEVLEEFDQKPAQARILIRLFQASPSAGRAPAGHAADKVPEELLANLTRVFESSSYQMLGAAEVEAELGEVVHAALGDRYLVQFMCLSDASRPGRQLAGSYRIRSSGGERANETDEATLSERHGGSRAARTMPPYQPPRQRFRLQHLTLYSLDPETGDERAVVQTSVALSADQRVVLSASASEDSRQGLVLVLENLTSKGLS